jgi:hypothetical protein
MSDPGTLPDFASLSLSDESTNISTDQPAHQSTIQPLVQTFPSPIHRVVTLDADFLLRFPAEIRNNIYKYLLVGVTSGNNVIRGTESLLDAIR